MAPRSAVDAPFSNVYDDAARARSYAALEFPGTYALAFRDIAALVRRHVHGTRALDFGCGTGRSSRFLRDLGLTVVGVDIAAAGDGDRVQIVMLDVPDRRPVDDVVCSDRRYRDLFAGAQLEVLEMIRPLTTGEEPVRWVSETTVAPWSVYVLGS